MASAKKLEDRCETLLAWLETSEVDFPQFRPEYAFQPAGLTAISNLFRDESFGAVFGQPFDQTTTEWRRKFGEDTFSRCQGSLQPSRNVPFQIQRRPLTAYADRTNRYANAIAPIFGLPGRSTVTPTQLASAVQQHRANTAWAAEAIKAASESPSEDLFDQITEAMGQLQDRFKGGWPKELDYYQAILTKRRSEVAKSLTDTWLASLGRFGTSFDDAVSIHTEYQTRNPIIAALPSTDRDATRGAVILRIHTALNQELDRRFAALSAVPQSLAGLEAARKWKGDLERSLSMFVGYKPYLDAVDRYRAAYDKLLEQSFPEWEKMLTSKGAEVAAAGLRELFPASGSSSTQYSRYQNRLEQQRQTEKVAAERRAEKERLAAIEARVQSELTKGIDPCDVYAGHPADSGKTANGFEDGDVKLEIAEKACAQAAASDSAAPRIHFQLGRVYWLARKYPQALESLLRAIEKNYHPAKYYIALMWRDGNVPGEAADQNEYRVQVNEAAAAKFRPALNEQFSIIFSHLKQPKWMEMLLSGHAQELDRQSGFGSYGMGILLFLRDRPHELDPACNELFTVSDAMAMAFRSKGLSSRARTDELAAAGLSALANMMQAGQSVQGLARMAQNVEDGEKLTEQGVHDMAAIAISERGCSGPRVKAVAATLSSYVYLR